MFSGFTVTFTVTCQAEAQARSLWPSVALSYRRQQQDDQHAERPQQDPEGSPLVNEETPALSRGLCVLRLQLCFRRPHPLKNGLPDERRNTQAVSLGYPLESFVVGVFKLDPGVSNNWLLRRNRLRHGHLPDLIGFSGPYQILPEMRPLCSLNPSPNPNSRSTSSPASATRHRAGRRVSGRSPVSPRSRAPTPTPWAIPW